MPMIAQIKQDPILTNVAIEWTPEGHIADQVAPPVRVAVEDGQYIVFDKSGYNVPEAQRRPRTQYKEIDWTLSKDNFHAEEYGLQTRIDDRERRAEGVGLTIDATSTEILTSNLLNIRERRITNLVLSTTNVPQNSTLVGADRWDDATGGDPIGISILAQNTIQAGTGLTPNTLALGFKVWQALRTNAALKAVVADGERLTKAVVAELLGVDEIIVGTVLYNTSKAGQTVVLGDMWGKDALFYHKQLRPAQRRPSFAYQFVVQDFRTFRWRDVPVNCDVIRVNEIRAEKIVASQLGYLVKTAVS